MFDNKMVVSLKERVRKATSGASKHTAIASVYINDKGISTLHFLWSNEEMSMSSLI